MRVLVFDTETTGLPKSRVIDPSNLHEWPYIVQFSYIIYDTETNTVLDVIDHVVKMPNGIMIPEESIQIHRITNEMSQQNGIYIEDVLDEFFEHLKNTDQLVGHNVSFDINMVKVELLRHIYGNRENIDTIKKYKEQLSYIYNYKNIICTSTNKNAIDFCNIEAKNKYGNVYLKYPKLIELYEKIFQHSPNGLHNSLNDIIVTLRCFMVLFHDIDIYKKSIEFKDLMKKNCISE